MLACDSSGSTSTIKSKEEWIKVKEQLDVDWHSYKSKNLGVNEAAKRFIKYADQISSSKILPPEIRFEESIILYREALKHVEDEKAEKKLKDMEAMYQVVNFN